MGEACHVAFVHFISVARFTSQSNIHFSVEKPRLKLISETRYKKCKYFSNFTFGESSYFRSVV